MIHHFSSQRPHTSYIIYLSFPWIHRAVFGPLNLLIPFESIVAHLFLGIEKNRTECTMENQRLENLCSSITQNMLQCFSVVLIHIVTTHVALQMAEQKDLHSSPVRAPKLQLTAGRLSTGECWIPLKKDTLHPRAKEKPQEDGRRDAIKFRIKPHTHQRHLEGSNKPCVHQNPEAPRRQTELCLSILRRGMSQQWPAARTGALGAVDLGMAEALLEEIAINPTTEPPEHTHDSGNGLLEGTNRTLCAPGPSTRGWPRPAHGCPGVSGGDIGRWWPAAWLGTEGNSTYMGPFEGGHLYLHSLHHSLPSSQTTGREHSPTHQQKIGLKIY